MKFVASILIMCVAVESKFFPCSSVDNQVSKFLSKNMFLTSSREIIQASIAIINQSNEVDDIIKEFLSKREIRRSYGVKLFEHQPRHMTSTFTDTIVFLDQFGPNISKVLKETLYLQRDQWRNESRYIFVVAKEFEEDIEDLKLHMSTLWTKQRLLNFLVLITLNRTLNVLSYNPFNDTYISLHPDIEYNHWEIFPDKLRNIHRYTISVSYFYIQPYYYQRENNNKGLDYDFMMTFLKNINATVRLIFNHSYGEVIEAVSEGSADMSSLGAFLFAKNLQSSGYPHGLLEMMPLVDKRGPISSIENLLSIFDYATWANIVVSVLLQYVLGRVYSRLSFAFSSRIRMICFDFLEVILTQTFQSWITTFLMYPRNGADIGSLDELILTGLPIMADDAWEDMVNEKLKKQYVFINYEQYFPIGYPLNGSIVLTRDHLKALFSSRKTLDAFKNYHIVPEAIATGHMAFYLGPSAPYHVILKEYTFRSLAYGYYSREWGGPNVIVADNVRGFKTLQIQHLRVVFYLWSYGIIASICVFFIEVLWYRCKA